MSVQGDATRARCAAAVMTVVAAFAAAACGIFDAGEGDRFVIQLAGDQQIGRVEQELADSLTAGVRQGGRGVASVVIQFVVIEGGGTVEPSQVTGNEGGVGSAVWTLGPEPGLQVVEARAEDAQSVRFQALAAVPVTFASVDVGGAHGCGQNEDGVSFCWGSNVAGEVGIGSDFSLQPVPARVIGEPDYSAVSTSGNRSCGVTPGGTVECWGDDRLEPEELISSEMFTAVSAGGFHGCALTGAGAAHCWGDNDFGQLGRPGSGGPVPEPVSGGLTFAAISSGSGHTCALTPAGAAYCWGDNGVGQLGLGLVPELVVDTPRAVAGGLAFDSIAAGSRHTCALTADGEAFCWGLADERLGAAQTAEAQCHDGGATNCVNTPTAAAGALRFDLISAGTLHTCGVGTDGTGYCWGDAGIGRLGTGMGTSADPAEVVGGLTFVDIDAGAEHTCGVTTDGEAFCWGANAFGQLGNGRLEESDVPVMVLGEIPPDDGS